MMKAYTFQDDHSLHALLSNNGKPAYFSVLLMLGLYFGQKSGSGRHRYAIAGIHVGMLF